MEIKSVAKKKKQNDKIFVLFGIGLNTLKYLWRGCLQLFWYLYVHYVQDSTLISYVGLLDQFRFYFVFSMVAKNRP